MKRFIKTTACILSIVFILSFCASCALYKDDKKSDAAGSDSQALADISKIREKYTQEQLDTPVITIGKRTVSFSEYLDFFQEIYTYYKTNYNTDIMESAETLTKFLDLITESLTKDTVVLYEADELGLSTLSDEQKAEIKANYDKEIAEMYDYYSEYVSEDESYSDDTSKSDAIEKYILDEAEYYCGEGTTIDEYMDYLYEKEEEKYLQNLVFEALTKDVTVSDDELKTWYDEHIENDTTYFKEHPADYKDECDSYETTGYISDGKTSIAPLYVPEGYGRIYHILIKSDNKVSDEYTENAKKMSELADEYGEIAFDNASNGETEANNDRLAEILTEYNNLRKKNQAELADIYNDAKAKADEAYAKLEAGEDFAKVMYEYTQDSNFKEDGAFAKKGQLISTRYTSDVDWSAEIKKEYGKAKKGEYSKVFVDSDGYHIIYHVSNEKQGKRTFNSVKDEIYSNLIDTAKQSSYDEQMEALVSGGAPVIRNDELIESLTKRIGE